MKLLTIPEAAKRARVCPRTMERLVEKGKGPTITKIARRRLIRDDHFLTWLDACANAGASCQPRRERMPVRAEGFNPRPGRDSPGATSEQPPPDATPANA